MKKTRNIAMLEGRYEDALIDDAISTKDLVHKVIVKASENASNNSK